MKRNIISLMIIIVLLGVGMLASVRSAAADAAYHTERLALEPVDDAPLRSGFVVNIHANGPNVYAHENYQLNGAAANTTYGVYLNIFVGNTSCEGAPDLVLNTAALVTNPAGNGAAYSVITPEMAEPIRGLTISAYWQVWNEAVVDYQTGCTVVTLD
jgi:hypothetical protein